MTKIISAFNARTHFGELIDLLFYKQLDEVIVEKRGKPVVRITKINHDDITMTKKQKLNKLAGSWSKSANKISKYTKSFRNTFSLKRQT